MGIRGPKSKFSDIACPNTSCRDFGNVDMENIVGNKEKQIEIIENLKEGLKAVPILKENLLQSREKILEQVKEKIEEEQSICPLIQKPAADFCQEGRIVIKKDEKGCVVEFKCVIPAEIELPEKPTTTSNIGACITLWDPVCGKNGKTYSNTCFAKLAGIEVEYKGECKERQCQTDADCPQLKCGPIGTITAKCVGMQTKCVEGECKIISETE